MFFDAKNIVSDTTIATTVCIIGAGAAGITLALEMERRGIDCCLLESGGFGPDDDSRDLYRGAPIGLPYRFADGCRSRYFGGSSNCWGGWCRPLDPWDFEQRDWVANSGWPLDLVELMPFYRRAQHILQLGPDNFDPAFWESAIGRPDVRRVPLSSGRVRDTISQFSPPVRFGKVYRKDLARTERVKVFLNANVTHIDTNQTASTVTRVQVATLCGKKMTVSAKLFVLATGGIENARLLLASNKVQAAGLGNGHDLVGRYFMDHPRLQSGQLHFRHGWQRNKLYDIKFHYMNAAVAAHGTHIAAQLALTSDTLRQERLLNSRVWFMSTFPGEGSAAAQALLRCKQAALQKEQAGWSLAHDMGVMLRHPLDTLGYGFTRVFQPRLLIRDVKFQIIVEPMPDPHSRVTLSPTERDGLGMPRVQVEWRLAPQVKRTVDRTLAIIADELRLGQVADVELDAPLEGGDWPASFEYEGTWHHMGTTRMHNEPQYGVVDRHAKVHGIGNLYVAGSSIFPTAGANFPTITLTALALRLADHLANTLGQPDAVLHGQTAPLNARSTADPLTI
jgi:choline dehydrogenase-like flavoprotein